jgi:predicted nucleic acid-binding protein
MTPDQRAQGADALAAVESPQQLRDRAHRLYELAEEMHNRGGFVEELDCLIAAAAVHALAVWKVSNSTGISPDFEGLQASLVQALAAVVRDE